jgi:uncharacterized protein YuzE
MGWKLGGWKMKITYDPQADVLYIELRQVQAHDNVDIEEGVSADLDGEGHVIGFEVLDISKRLTPVELHTLNVENLAILQEDELAGLR